MAEKTNSYQDYQDAQSQLLNIQAQQQANLQEARLMGQSQMATNNVLSQAAEVAAQTVAMGNTTQPATFNPTTQAVLQQYGLGQPRVVRTQNRNQSTTPQHVTINNNTSNITNNNVSVPANIGGPLQGRPVQINPDVQMGTFKTWLSNVFAQQNAESARRDREYEKREAALSRNANKVLKKIGEIGGNIGKALDPRRATSSSVNTIRTLFTVLGIAKLAKNWDVIAEKLDGLFNFFKGKSSRERSDSGDKSFFVRMRETLVSLLGGQAEGDNAEGVLLALRRLFYTKEGEDSANGKGILNLALDRIKIELKNRFEAASAAAKAYRESNKSDSKIGRIIDNAIGRLLGATEAIFKSFISMDSSHVINDAMENTADEASNKEINGNYWSNGVQLIKTMASKRGRKELEANLSYGNDKATFKYDEKGRLLTHENEEAIDLSNININNVVDFGDRVNKNSDLHFDPEQFVNEQGNINIENGDLMGIYLASRDIAINLLRAYSKPKKFSESIQSALTGIKRLDRVFEDNNLDRIPIHDDFVSVLSSSILKKLENEKRRYKILVRERFKDVNQDRTIWTKASESIGSKTQTTTRYTFVLLPSAGEDDKGDDGLTHMLYTISREDLREIVNIYTGTDKSNKVYDLQSNQFSLNFANTAYNNTEAKIKDTSEVEAAMAEFRRWYGVNNQEQYLKDLEAWNNEVDKSRPKQMAENIAKTEFFNKLDEAKGSVGDFISGKIDQLTGKVYKKKSEFIEKLYEPLNKILAEEFPETLGGEENKEIRDIYTKLLLSQLALESGWGKHQAGNNNLGGIKAPKNSDGTPIDEDHAQQYWTKEILNGGPEKYPKLKDRAKPGFPYQMTQDKWMWVIKDYFKTYDTPEDFLKDYVKKLKNNWPEAMEGVEESEDNLPTYFAMKLKNGKKGPYYTANEDSYRDSLKSIYKTIEDVQERAANKQSVEEDEIPVNEDLEKEEQRGISQVKVGSIADEDVGGGDGEYSIPTYNNPYNNEGDENVGLYYSGNSGDNTKTYNNIVPNNGYNEFNVDEAINTLRENTNWKIDAYGNKLERRSDPTKSYHYCARHVMVALRKGGVKISGVNHASQFLEDQSTWPNSGKVIAGKKDGVPLIVEDGFEEIQPGNFQAGDVSVEEAVNPYGSGKSNTMGHMAMYDGTQWISDFKQRSPVVHSTAPGRIHYFRYTGNKVHGGVVSSGSSSYSPDYGNYKKDLEDDFLSRFTNALNDFTAKSREAIAENNVNNSGMGGDITSENCNKILSMLSQILNSQNSIAFNTAATADEVRANTEITAQQINRPVETRTPASSMMGNRSNSNYGG